MTISRDDTAYESYVICTSPRSGSTLLCNLLAKTGVAGNPDSWFHQSSLAYWLEMHDLSADPAASEGEVLEAIFRAAIAAGSRGGMFGLRLQRDSFDFFVGKLAVLHPGLSSDAERFHAAFGRTAYIHLTRGDKVEQAVSYVKAKQSCLWHVAPDGSEIERLSAPREPVYDAGAIRACVESMEAADRDWKAWFAREGIAPLRVAYEAFSAAPVDTLRDVLVHLGLDPDAANGIEPGVAKLADATSRDWVARYRTETGAN